MEQEQLYSIRKGAELGTGMTLADIEGESARDILGVYLQMSHAILSLVDEVERLQKLEAEPEVKVNPYTGEVEGGKGNPRQARTFAPIGNTGHYGPIREGAVVQALCDVKYADIMKGEIGKLTKFDTWPGEEYPYIATFDGGRKAAFAREDIRRVD